MVAGLQQYLQTVHETTRAVGVEELCRLPGMPDVRSVYRWHDALGDDLIYFPSIALQSLGLVHLHVFIDDPTASWEDCKHAIRALWVVRSPGRRTLYLHCVVPAEDGDHVRACIQEKARHQGVTIITTRDGWQALSTPTFRSPPATPITDARGVIAHYPLIIPAVFEALESRKSYPALWEAICQRLGDRVWEYLPRFSRRLPHNGKQYVREAFRCLTDAHLVRQHLIRYAPMREFAVELLLLVSADTDDVLAAFGGAVALEVYPADNASLVHVHAPLSCLTTILSATLSLPITACWFVDRTTNEAQPLQVRFDYETLFDPQTGTWVRA